MYIIKHPNGWAVCSVLLCQTPEEAFTYLESDECSSPPMNSSSSPASDDRVHKPEPCVTWESRIEYDRTGRSRYPALMPRPSSELG